MAEDVLPSDTGRFRDLVHQAAFRVLVSVPGEQIRLGVILESVIDIPVEMDGRVLVDGQLVDPVPVSACREMGAEIVVAIDINPPNAAEDAKPLAKLNIVDIMTGTLTILNCELTRRSFRDDPPDVLIRPDVGKVLSLDFRRATRLVEIGRQAVDSLWPQVGQTLPHS